MFGGMFVLELAMSLSLPGKRSNPWRNRLADEANLRLQHALNDPKS